MVAFEPLTNPEKNVNVDPTAALNAAVKDYREEDERTKASLRSELNKLNKPYIEASKMTRGKEMDEFLESVEKLKDPQGVLLDNRDYITKDQRSFNVDSRKDTAELERLFKRIQKLSDKSVKEIGKNNRILTNTIDKYNIDDISSHTKDILGDRNPNVVMGNISNAYSENLKNERKNMQEIMNEINTYDAELSILN